MFTGLVEEVGVVRRFESGRSDTLRLDVEAGIVPSDGNIGDSIAVNGCCLTIVSINERVLGFELLAETVARTSFAGIKVGSLLNLERSLAVGSRMGGHFVTGHVDSTGEIVAFGKVGDDVQLRVRPPAEFLKYIAYKGSIAIDGISLTVAEVTAQDFLVCLIPHTLEVTNLKDRNVGDRVNLEFDLLAKYVERVLQGREAAPPTA